MAGVGWGRGRTSRSGVSGGGRAVDLPVAASVGDQQALLAPKQQDPLREASAAGGQQRWRGGVRDGR